MKLEVERSRLIISPESDVDIAYIEEVLGLEKEGDTIKLSRRNAHMLSCIAYLETKKEVKK